VARSTGSQIQVVQLAGARLAFLNAETARARARALEDMALTDAALERHRARPRGAILRSTKYRVYQRWVARPASSCPKRAGSTSHSCVNS
jgi:hypothetical protein